MKITRELVNEKKTYLFNALVKIEKTFDTIEDTCQYQAVFELCTNLTNYCNFWCKKIAPNKLVYYLSRKRRKLYDVFSEYSMFVVDTMQSMLDQFNEAENKINEQAKRKSELEEKIRLEHDIINTIKEEDIIHNNHKILGFAKYATVKKPKHKNNKKKNG